LARKKPKKFVQNWFLNLVQIQLKTWEK
jgi:hypothetical protein